MQKCDNCNTSFKWAKIFKENWLGYNPIKCEKCNAKHKITIPSRFIFVALTILPMVVFGMFLLPQYFFGNLYVFLLIMLIIPFIGSLFTPFLVKHKKIDT